MLEEKLSFKCEIILFCEEKNAFDQSFDYKFDLKKNWAEKKKLNDKLSLNVIEQFCTKMPVNAYN